MNLARRVFWIKLLTILVLMGLWEGLSRSGLFYKGVLPSTWMVVQAIAGELADSGFYHDLGITMLETSVGFVAGAIIALLFALVLGTNAYIRKMIEPYIIAIGGTPKIIFLPILFLIFGLGIESKMAKAALSAFFPIVLSVTSGIVQIPPVLLRVGQGFDPIALANADEDLSSSRDQFAFDGSTARHRHGDHRRAIGGNKLCQCRSGLPSHPRRRPVQDLVGLCHHHPDLHGVGDHQFRHYPAAAAVKPA